MEDRVDTEDAMEAEREAVVVNDGERDGCHERLMELRELSVNLKVAMREQAERWRWLRWE